MPHSLAEILDRRPPAPGLQLAEQVLSPLRYGPNTLVGRKVQRLIGNYAGLVDLPLLRIGGGHCQLHDRAGLEMPRVLGCERGIEDRLGSVGLAERYKARALVVGDVEPVVSKVHAVPAFVGQGSVHRVVGKILRLAECPWGARSRSGRSPAGTA
jgi:hypothetical protein